MRIQALLEGAIAQATVRSSFVLSLRLLMQGGTLVLLTHLLGPTGFGAYVALGALAAMLGTMASFGTQLTLLRDIARDPTARDDSLRLALGTSVLCGSMLLCAYVLLCLLWLRPAEGGVIAIACLGLAELVLQPIFFIAAMERHAQGQVAKSQLLLTVPLFLRLLCAVLVNWFAPAQPLVVFSIGHFLAVLLALVIAIAIAPVPWPTPSRWRLPHRAEWRNASGYAILNTSTSGMAELDKLLAVRLLSPGPAGIYAAASRVISALMTPVIAMTNSAMPRLFREADHSKSRLHHWLFCCSAFYGLIAGLCAWLFGSWVQPLFGQNYRGIEEVIGWLAWAVPAISLRSAAVTVLTTIDLPWLRVVMELFGALTIAALALGLTPSQGSFGLALSVVCAEWLIASISWCAVWRSSRAQKKAKSV